MNNTFIFNRFRLLVRRQWTENKKVYLLLWGVISLSLMVLSFFSERYDLYLLYILLFCFGGCVMTTTLFSRWSDFGRSSFFLLLPASITEKFLCGLIYGIILFIPLYCLNYFVTRFIFTYLVILLFPDNLLPFSAVVTGGINEITKYPFSFYAVVFLTFLFTQSLFMIILVRFKKNQILILLLTIMAILVLYNSGIYILMSNIVHIRGGSIRHPGPFLTFFSADFGYRSLHNQAYFDYFSFTKLIWKLNDLMWFVVFFMLYLTTRFNLREREL